MRPHKQTRRSRRHDEGTRAASGLLALASPRRYLMRIEVGKKRRQQADYRIH